MLISSRIITISSDSSSKSSEQRNLYPIVLGNKPGFDLIEYFTDFQWAERRQLFDRIASSGLNED